MGAHETLPMPWLVLVCHTSTCDDLGALDTSSGEFLFIAAGAKDLLFARDKALRANRGLANYAAEAFLVPLSSFVFHLLCPGSEDFSATVASGGELSVIAATAVDFLDL